MSIVEKWSRVSPRECAIWLGIEKAVQKHYMVLVEMRGQGVVRLIAQKGTPWGFPLIELNISGAKLDKKGQELQIEFFDGKTLRWEKSGNLPGKAKLKDWSLDVKIQELDDALHHAELQKQMQEMLHQQTQNAKSKPPKTPSIIPWQTIKQIKKSYAQAPYIPQVPHIPKDTGTGPPTMPYQWWWSEGQWTTSTPDLGSYWSSPMVVKMVVKNDSTTVCQTTFIELPLDPPSVLDVVGKKISDHQYQQASVHQPGATAVLVPRWVALYKAGQSEGAYAWTWCGQCFVGSKPMLSSGLKVYQHEGDEQTAAIGPEATLIGIKANLEGMKASGSS